MVKNLLELGRYIWIWHWHQRISFAVGLEEIERDKSSFLEMHRKRSIKSNFDNFVMFIIFFTNYDGLGSSSLAWFCFI